MMASLGERVFVYGTLRRGASNHRRLAGAAWVGDGTVRGRLYRIDWYPGLVLDDAAGEVRGEVHEVDAATLAALDAYEGSEYRRVRVAVVGGVASGGPGTVLEAWAWEWIGPIDEARRIRSGDWLG